MATGKGTTRPARLQFKLKLVSTTQKQIPIMELLRRLKVFNVIAL